MIEIQSNPARWLVELFFRDMAGDPYFPHSFDPDKRLENRNWRDEHWFIMQWNRIIGYGMVRGWNDKWNEKVVGLCIHPDERNRGWGRFLLCWLERLAKNRRLESLRIHVSDKNLQAYSLYKKMGYIFDGTKTEKGDLIGRKAL